MKVPNIRFNLKFSNDNGGEVVIRTLDDLKRYHDIEALYSYMMDGTLSRWLKSLREVERESQIENARDLPDVQKRKQAMLEALSLGKIQPKEDAELTAESTSEDFALNVKAEISQTSVVDEQIVNDALKSVNKIEERNESQQNQNCKLSGADKSRLGDLQYQTALMRLVGSSKHAKALAAIMQNRDFRIRFFDNDEFVKFPHIIPFLFLDYPDASKKIRFLRTWDWATWEHRDCWRIEVKQRQGGEPMRISLPDNCVVRDPEDTSALPIGLRWIDQTHGLAVTE